LDLSYILNELGEDRERYFNAVAPPVMQTSIFAFKDVAAMRHSVKREYDDPFYSRGNNPTVEMLRKKLAALEGAEDALVFASGSAAIATAVTGNINAGEHIVSVAKPYSWTGKLLSEWLPRFGVTTTFVDGTRVEHFAEAIRPNTKLIYLESPNSLTFELQDIEAVAALAKKHGITTIIDNSYASPLYQQPVAMGVDVVIHSASKYIGGHSDVVAGVVCGTGAMMRKLFAAEYMTFGGIISPMNAWLLLRGLRTLPLRLERISDSTARVVQFLENHPQVEKVCYPFSESHPQHQLACRQMKRGTGLFTIALRTRQIPQVETFCNALKRFILAVSWGGYESLVFPSCVTLDAGAYDPGQVQVNLVRLYIGLEDPQLLIEDLGQALKQMADITDHQM
jgi:cystathionine beta-lyase/cystathionine gamma-synthase